MLLKTQRNKLFQELQKLVLQPVDFKERYGNNWYRLEMLADKELYFEVQQKSPDVPGRDYIINRLPGYDSSPDIVAVSHDDGWENGSYGIWPCFRRWAAAVKREVDAPDLWLESTKALHFFASPDAPVADRFTIAELGAVQGQLNMLSKSFGTSELPEEAKQRLAEIAQTAMLKAETLTKKDWQYWIQGAFSSTVTSLELTEAQIQEVVALIRLAFGGLFLHA